MQRNFVKGAGKIPVKLFKVLVEVRGFEPLTSGLQSPRSAKLSYTPTLKFEFEMVGLSRFELLTSRLSGVRSNQLSYRPLGHFCRKIKPLGL